MRLILTTFVSVIPFLALAEPPNAEEARIAVEKALGEQQSCIRGPVSGTIFYTHDEKPFTEMVPDRLIFIPNDAQDDWLPANIAMRRAVQIAEHIKQGVYNIHVDDEPTDIGIGSRRMVRAVRLSYTLSADWLDAQGDVVEILEDPSLYCVYTGDYLNLNARQTVPLSQIDPELCNADERFLVEMTYDFDYTDTFEKWFAWSGHDFRPERHGAYALWQVDGEWKVQALGSAPIQESIPIGRRQYELMRNAGVFEGERDCRIRSRSFVFRGDEEL